MIGKRILYKTTKSIEQDIIGNILKKKTTEPNENVIVFINFDLHKTKENVSTNQLECIDLML